MLQAHLRYFDPQRHRPGLPEHIAALVDRVSTDQVSVSLVNTDPVEGRVVLLQAGSFGEHCFTRARLETREGDDQSVEVDGKYLRVHLGPGAQMRLHLGLQRFAFQPSYALPPFTCLQ